MSEQFVKLHKWMATDLHLSGSELIAFAVIYGYTQSCGAYQGGMEMLGEWCGTTRQNAYRYLKPLVEKGLVKQVGASGGRNAARYVAVGKPSQIETVEGKEVSRLTVSKRDGKPSQIETHIDNIDIIDKPPISPLKGGSENADAKPDKKRRRRISRTMNYMQGQKYTEDELRRMGISLGEEFYDDATSDAISEMRIT